MKKLFSVTMFAAALAACSLLSGCGQIDSDQAGFKTSFGKPDYEVLGPGLYGINPFGGELVRYPIRDMRTDVKLPAYTKDMQQADFQVAVIYAPDRAKLIELHTKFGRDYAQVIIEPAVAAAVKDVVGTWEADQLVNGRDKATAAIREKVEAALKDAPVLLKGLAVLNIDYSEAFEKAIEEKVVQQQAAIKARNRTAQVEEEARQKLIIARSAAESMNIQGEAIRKNKDIILYEAIQKWDGKAPQTLSLGSGQNMFLPAKP